MADSNLAKVVASIVIAVFVGIILYFFSFAFLWWQIPILVLLTGLGTYESLLGNRIWTALITVIGFLVLLAPVLLMLK